MNNLNINQIYVIAIYLKSMQTLSIYKYVFSTHTRYCILGGGTGGISITAHLIRSGVHPKQIRIIEPSNYHAYQPGWTMVGAGMWSIAPTIKQIQEVVPQGVALHKNQVKMVDPLANTVVCLDGSKFTYNELVVGTGLQLNYQKIEGLKQALDDPHSNVSTIYELKYAQKLAKLGERLKTGKAIFTEPALPFKCPGAPQKILYLWSDIWSKNKLPISAEFFKTSPVMFSIAKYAPFLTKIANNYNITTHFKHSLIKVSGNTAVFQNLQTKQLISKQFQFLHVVPPMKAHDYIQTSGLADRAGYLNCDKETLRHKRYLNIWGVGDCTNLPTAKTAAAVFSQVETLLQNLLAVRINATETVLPAKYDGYAGCPLFVGKGKLMLAEFKYDGVVDQSFYKDQEIPRYQFYLLKKIVFPLSYWWLVPIGRWMGRKGIVWK